MSGVNLCVFVGHCGRDPEMRKTNSGKDVCNFTIAVNERKDGEPLWLTVICFDKLAGVVKQYVSKGKQVYVQGRLQVREYEHKGEKRTAVEVVASSVTFLGGGSGGVGKKASKPAAVDDFDDPGSVPF